MYRIELVIAPRFLQAAKGDLEWLCGEGNVTVVPGETSSTLIGMFQGDPEKFHFLKGNWSTVGQWNDGEVPQPNVI